MQLAFAMWLFITFWWEFPKFVFLLFRTDPNIVKSEMMLEVPAAKIDFTKAQLLLVIYIQQSWIGKNQTNNWLQETSLMQDVFTTEGK